MGFHVGLDRESESLIELVTTDPSKVLGKLYSAYMLFLVGDPDEAELKWFLSNAKALDSLTGDYIAYAVFAEKFKVTLRTSSWKMVKRPPRNVGNVSLDDIPKRSSVTRLVKDGAFGMIVDGDELTAITYGTDRVARALGILDQLPCIIVVDAVPQQDLCIIHLDSELTGQLIPLLRRAINSFAANGGDKTIKNYAERIIHLQDVIAIEHRRAAKPRREIDRLTHKIEKLKGAIEYGRPAARLQLEEVLRRRSEEREELMTHLEHTSAERAEILDALESDLDTLLREYRSLEHVLFSNILRKEIEAFGLKSKLAAGKTATATFFGSLLKPDVLLKLWALVHS